MPAYCTLPARSSSTTCTAIVPLTTLVAQRPWPTSVNVVETAVTRGPGPQKDPKTFTNPLEKETKAKEVLIQALETWSVPSALQGIADGRLLAS